MAGGKGLILDIALYDSPHAHEEDAGYHHTRSHKNELLHFLLLFHNNRLAGRAFSKNGGKDTKARKKNYVLQHKKFATIKRTNLTK